MDDTVEVKSFDSAFTHFVANRGGHCAHLPLLDPNLANPHCLSHPSPIASIASDIAIKISLPVVVPVRL